MSAGAFSPAPFLKIGGLLADLEELLRKRDALRHRRARLISYGVQMPSLVEIFTDLAQTEHQLEATVEETLIAVASAGVIPPAEA